MDAAIKNKAFNYLARREHSVKELESKLAQHFTDHDQIKQALEELQTEGYLSNARFLESRIRHRLAQGYGRLRITQELTQIHALKNDEIHAAFANIPDTESELEQLCQLIQKKHPQLDPQNKTELAKVTKKLLQRGFSYDLIRTSFQSML